MERRLRAPRPGAAAGLVREDRAVAAAEGEARSTRRPAGPAGLGPDAPRPPAPLVHTVADDYARQMHTAAPRDLLPQVERHLA
jgi:hypothetical protein